ncbi:MAG: M56 family metallopeptidase [Bacteroidota bacterium]
MHYLLSASIVLLFAWPACYFLLRHSNRFGLNRWLLLAVIGMVALLPLVTLQSPLPEASSTLQGTIDYVVSGPATAPVMSVEELAPVDQSFTKSPAESVAESTNTAFAFSWSGAYLIGLILFLAVLAFRLVALLTLHLRSRPNGDASYRLLHLSAKPGQAFTFGTQLYFSIDVPDGPDFDHVLAHERVHARQGHSFDILVSELLLCLFWFHPVAWWLRGKLRANLEYLVDAAVISGGTNRRAYQLALVRQSQHQHLALALPFSEPTLKGRIARMTGLPQHRVVALLATLALLFWVGIAGLVVYGTATPDYREGEPFVEYYAEVLPDSIYAFDLYAKRVPTINEFYQIRAILKQIPGTELYLWKDEIIDEYRMELHHGRKIAKLERFGVEGEHFVLRDYRLGLVTDAWQEQVQQGHLKAVGSLTPMAETCMCHPEIPNDDEYTMCMYSDKYISSPQDRQYNRLRSDEKLLVKVNGVEIPLLPPNITQTISSKEDMFLFDNNSVAPIQWEPGQYFPPLKPHPSNRMAALLGCTGSKRCPRSIEGIRDFTQEQAVALIEEHVAVDYVPVRVFHNDVEVELATVMQKKWKPNSLFQIGYRTDDQLAKYGYVIQLIDDGPAKTFHSIWK